MKKSTKGFTLVELIVVIGVLLILAVIAVAAYQNVQINARISAARASVTTLASVWNNLEAMTGGKVDEGDFDMGEDEIPDTGGTWFHIIEADDDPDFGTGADEMRFAATIPANHTFALAALERDPESELWRVKAVTRDMLD